MRLLLLASLVLALGAEWFFSAAVAQKTSPSPDDPYLLQDIVTWDTHSVKIFNERLMLYSAEFHPFR